MKSYSNLIHEFSAWQRRELEALFIVLDWTKNYQKKHPNNRVGREWLNATELTIRIIYDDAFTAVKNRGIAFHSGSDTTEAPPEVIRCVVEDLEKHSCSPYVKIESSNYFYFGKPSTSSDTNDTCSDMVNIMYFGPAYRIVENRNSSTEDIPFGFQFPNSMHFNFGDKKQSTFITRDNSTSSLSCQTVQSPSGVTLTESEQKEMFLPFPAMYFIRSPKDEKSPQMHGSTKQEVPEIYESSQLDLKTYFDSSLESQSSNPAIEFFRISSGFIPPPKNSDIAERQCTSPFCLCSSVKAAYKNEINEDSMEDDDDISEGVPIEPYLEVENINFPKLELPDLLDDTPESFMLLQPFNTPNETEELETSSESVCNENVRDNSFSSITMPGTPRNNPDDIELMLQPFNTPVTPEKTSGSTNMDTFFSDSLGVADLGLDEDVTKILAIKCCMDNDQEYIRQERLRILSSYEKSRLTEQQRSDGNDNEANGNNNFVTSTPNRYCDTSMDKYCSRDK